MRCRFWCTMLLILPAIGSSEGDRVPTGDQRPLVGGGSTLAAPLYGGAIAEFEPNGVPHIFYNRDPSSQKEDNLGSEKGIRQLEKHRLDFAGTDWPILAIQNTIQIPTVATGVVIVYNVPGLTKPKPFATQGSVKQLNLSAGVLARIFQGTIKRWNDPYIQRENPDLRLQLPSEQITPVCRSDGSGTTHIFTNFLTKLGSGIWQNRGDPFKIKCAKGSLGAIGNDELAKTVGDNDNSIGYVEYEYAMVHNLVQAQIQNKSGRFVAAGISTIRASVPSDASATLETPEQLQGMFPLGQDENAYPISGFTWLVVRRPSEPSKTVVCNFLYFLIDWLEFNSESLGYASLPVRLAERNRDTTDQICLAGTLNFDPTSGPAGTRVSITLVKPAADAKNGTVRFGGVKATTFSVESDFQIAAVVPAAAVTGKIRLETRAAVAVSTTDFKVMPSIVSFNPSNGHTGTKVTILGTNFTDPIEVTFGGVPASKVPPDSDTQITVTVPTGAASGKIRLATTDGTATSVADFTVMP